MFFDLFMSRIDRLATKVEKEVLNYRERLEAARSVLAHAKGTGDEEHALWLENDVAYLENKIRRGEHKLRELAFGYERRD